MFKKLVLTGAAALGGLGVVYAGVYNIDVVLPLTGEAAFWGRAEQFTLSRVEKAVNDDGGIGGQNVKFNFHDDQSSPQVAVQLWP